MKFLCAELDKFLGLRSVEWFYVDDLIVCRSGFWSSRHYPSSYFIKKGLANGCPQCLSITMLIALRQRMRSQHGGGGNNGHKRL